jgi:hypothetical protein
MSEARMNVIDQDNEGHGMTEDGLRKIFGIVLASLITLLLILFVLYQAIQSGIIVALMLGLIIVIALLSFSLDRLTNALRNFQEARLIARAHSVNVKTDSLNRRREYTITINSPAPLPLLASAAPQQGSVPDWVFDPIREVAINLVKATIQNPVIGNNSYGPDSQKLLTQKDAEALGIVTGGAQHTQVTDYLRSHYKVFTRDGSGKMNGTYCQGKTTVTDLLRDMAVDQIPASRDDRLTTTPARVRA